MEPAADTSPPPGIPGVRRPERSLLYYYALQSLLLGPLFPLVLLPRYFRFRTLTFHFDDEGISARWGALFRREVSLGYSRIQDIHLTSNLVERWLGLARVQIQTASGKAGAELVIEGLPDAATVRDWLYSRMRGARRRQQPGDSAAPVTPAPAGGDEAVVTALAEATRELRRLRELLSERPAHGDGG